VTYAWVGCLAPLLLGDGIPHVVAQLAGNCPHENSLSGDAKKTFKNVAKCSNLIMIVTRSSGKN
jgi:hypothetical protein